MSPGMGLSILALPTSLDVRWTIFSVTFSCFGSCEQIGNSAERKFFPLASAVIFLWISFFFQRLVFCPVSAFEPAMWQKPKDAWITFLSLESGSGNSPTNRIWGGGYYPKKNQDGMDRNTESRCWAGNLPPTPSKNQVRLIIIIRHTKSCSGIESMLFAEWLKWNAMFI